MFDPDEAFGHLRSLMNQPSLHEHQRKELKSLLQKAVSKAPQTYAAQWVPYLGAFERHFNWSWETLHSFKELSREVTTYPFAKFSFHSVISRAKIKSLVPHATSLYALKFDHSDLDDRALRTLASLPPMTNLVSLSLQKNRITHKGLIDMGKTHLFPALRQLNLYHNWIDLEMMSAVNFLPHIKTLESLNIGSNRVRNLGAIMLADCTHLTRLQHLNLEQNDVGINGVKALMEASHLSGLTTLDLNRNKVRSKGVRMICDSAHVTKLQELHLGGNDIDDQGAIALANASNLERLTSLNLRDNDISDEGVRALLRSTKLPSLRSLNMDNNPHITYSMQRVLYDSDL